MEDYEDPVIVNVVDGKVSASTGLDFLTNVHVNVMDSEVFWKTHVRTFHVQGNFLLYSQLEVPDLKECFAQTKVTAETLRFDYLQIQCVTHFRFVFSTSQLTR